MNYSTQSLGIILLKVPGAVPMVVDWVSKFISLGVAFIAQIPFTVRTSLISVDHVYNNDHNPTQKANKKNYQYWVSNITFQTFRIISSIANGAITACGAGNNIFMIVVGAMSGFINSFTGMSDPGDEDIAIHNVDNRYIIKPIFFLAKIQEKGVISSQDDNLSSPHRCNADSNGLPSFDDSSLTTNEQSSKSFNS